jgi:hypothetical protein
MYPPLSLFVFSIRVGYTLSSQYSSLYSSLYWSLCSPRLLDSSSAHLYSSSIHPLFSVYPYYPIHHLCILYSSYIHIRVDCAPVDNGIEGGQVTDTTPWSLYSDLDSKHGLAGHDSSLFCSLLLLASMFTVLTSTLTALPTAPLAALLTSLTVG